VQQHDFVEVIKSIQAAKDLDRGRIARIECMYVLHFHLNDISPDTLIEHLIEEPAFFVQLVSQVFRSDLPEEEAAERLEIRQQRARNAYEFIHIVDRVPGQVENAVDPEKLKKWVVAAREGCAAKGRAEVGDLQIGQLLAQSPTGTDGIWPHEHVRDILELVDSEPMERGLSIARQNARGVTSRSFGEGGLQEKDLAARYRADAVAVMTRWPRTGALLNSLARSYARDANWHDRDAVLRR